MLASHAALMCGCVVSPIICLFRNLSIKSLISIKTFQYKSYLFSLHTYWCLYFTWDVIKWLVIICCVSKECGSGFESSCSHFTFRFRTCFEQGVPWHSGNYRVWIHSETRTWHDKNIQSQNILWNNSSIQMWSTSKDWKKN